MHTMHEGDNRLAVLSIGNTAWLDIIKGTNGVCLDRHFVAVLVEPIGEDPPNGYPG